MRREICRDVLLENGAVFTPVPMSEMSEPEFLNRLYREKRCGVLLDLRRFYVQERNGSLSRDRLCRGARSRRGVGDPHRWRG